MIEIIRQYLITLEDRYPHNTNDQQHARALFFINSFLSLLTFFSILAQFNSQVLSTLLGTTAHVTVSRLLAFMMVMHVANLILVHVGRLQYARIIFVANMFLWGTANLWLHGPTSMTAVYILLTPLAAGMLFGQTGAFATTFTVAATITLTALAQLTEVVTFEPAVGGRGIVTGSVFVLLLSVLAVSLMLRFFSENLRQTVSQSTRMAQQLRAVAEIGQFATEGMESENFLPQLVEMIRDRMAFFHVQVFLVDEAREYAHLAASTGPIGQQLLERKHKLGVGSRSVIGQVTRRGRLVYATDTSEDPVHYSNEFLSASRSELALPLKVGGWTIGALDVQSTEADAFTQKDIETLEIMASQISIALGNRRLFEQIRSSMEENARLYNESQQGLKEVERLNRQLTGQAWEDFLGTSAQFSGVEITEGEVHRRAHWTPALMQAAKEERPIIQQQADGPVVAVPLEVHGQIIGAIEVTLPPNTDPRNAQELVQAVSSRLSLALDNNRLFEEAQVLAQQEHVINEVGERLQRAADVDEILQVTLVELSQLLGAENAAVRLRATPMMMSDSEQN